MPVHWVKVAGGVPNLIWQETKSQLDPMDEAVRSALLSEPDVYISMSANKIGKDLKGVANPYTAPDGTKYDSIGGYLITAKSAPGGFGRQASPRVCIARRCPVDFDRLKADCAWLAERLSRPSRSESRVPAVRKSPSAPGAGRRSSTTATTGGPEPAATFRPGKAT